VGTLGDKAKFSILCFLSLDVTLTFPPRSGWEKREGKKEHKVKRVKLKYKIENIFNAKASMLPQYFQNSSKFIRKKNHLMKKLARDLNTHFTKEEDVQMSINPISKVQIKTITRVLRFTRRAKIKDNYQEKE
jgi:hypothetical protein